MFQNMTLFHWIALAFGVMLVGHSMKWFDATTLPVIGGIAKAIGLKPWKNVETQQTLRVYDRPSTAASTIANATAAMTELRYTPAVDELSPHERCDALQASLVNVRHFISERPTERAAELLGACDLLEKEIGQYHTEHTIQSDNSGSGY